MRIVQSNVAMLGSSQHKLAIRSVQTAVGAGVSGFSSSLLKSTQQQKSGMLSISGNTGNTYRGGSNVSGTVAARPKRIGFNPLELKEDLQATMLRRIIELLLSRNGKRYNLTEIPENEEGIRALKQELERARNIGSINSPGTGIQVARVKNVSEIYESQSMTFEMSANVRTADGREIDVGIMLNMSAEFYAKTESTWTQSVMKDPLVINFNGNANMLSNQKFEFDLDCDGEVDQISQLMSGNGFLAWDQDEDGKINDGSELFGALTGDGFSELARHDSDGNGWIDENDDIFNSLRVWYKDETGMDRLVSLGESGVGAIFLGNVSTTYMLKEDFDNLNGMLRSTGFYLNEDGTAGTIHHVDMVV